MQFLLLLLFLSSLYAVDERDWTNDWPYRVIKNLESIPSISVDEIEGYEFSITYALDGGRFGDQLTNYLRALWVSWKYELPFYYRPFDYSDQLCISSYHPHLNNQKFDAKLEYFHFLDLDKTRTVFSYLDRKDSCSKKLIWNVGMLTPFIEEHFCEKLDDEAFRAFIKPIIQPKEELNLIAIPKERKSIAIHVRTGVGYDWKINIENMPTKFPPETFYLAGLKEAFKFFEGEPLYIYLFTDHPDPVSLKESFIKRIIFPINSVFECRHENRHDQNVLEDLFSMASFDAIIHPDSSISRLAVILSAPIFEVKPSHWAEVRLNSDGIAVLDKNGQFIVDPLIIQRASRGKDIVSMKVHPITKDIIESNSGL